LEFNLESLVRLDLRADQDGKLYILEANPKPDLKRPSEGVTSLICAGLPEAGMDYDDLIFSLLADRLDLLLRHRRGTISHIVEMLGSDRVDAAKASGISLDDSDAGARSVATGKAGQKVNVELMAPSPEEAPGSARASGLPAAGHATVNNRHGGTPASLRENPVATLVNNLVADLNLLGLDTVLEGPKGAVKDRSSVASVKPPRSRGARAR
jgi:hypothetical protein